VYRHFLVPLDGSHLAEAVLDGTLELARRCGARLTLLHILEQSAPAKIHGDRHLRHIPEAEAYLAGLAARLDFPHARLTFEVHPHPEADVALSIFRHAAELNADLVVLSTHGLIGLREWLFGSVAQKVLRREAPPVFMLQPTARGTAPEFRPARALVYLDGTTAGEAGLTAVEPLARQCGIELHLVMCIPTRSALTGGRAATGTLLPTTMAAILDLAERDATDQLRAQLERLQASGVTATAQVVRGDPLSQLVEAALHLPADILCLTTRGESGLEALGTEEVAPKILTRFHGAFFLVHNESELPARPRPDPAQPAPDKARKQEDTPPAGVVPPS
jgi:nucleotide-binding universal stress UspA family protein